jgi:hypothetical protein
MVPLCVFSAAAEGDLIVRSSMPGGELTFGLHHVSALPISNAKLPQGRIIDKTRECV